jgi:hypothetical protein
VMAYNLARWTARIGLGTGIVTAKTLRRQLFGLAGRLTRSTEASSSTCQRAGPGRTSSPPPSRGSGPCRSSPDRALIARGARTLAGACAKGDHQPPSQPLESRGPFVGRPSPGPDGSHDRRTPAEGLVRRSGRSDRWIRA